MNREEAAYRLKGENLYRVGADDGCVWCGMPDIKGFLVWAHIDERDLHFSPNGDDRRVFRLCWFHHHSCYDQGYIKTEELIEAEEAWIAGRRPKPHPRDLALADEVKAGRRTRDCRWTRPARPRLPKTPVGTVMALQAHRTRWENRLKTGELSKARRREAKAKIAEYDRRISAVNAVLGPKARSAR